MSTFVLEMEVTGFCPSRTQWNLRITETLGTSFLSFVVPISEVLSKFYLIPTPCVYRQCGLEVYMAGIKELIESLRAAGLLKDCSYSIVHRSYIHVYSPHRPNLFLGVASSCPLLEVFLRGGYRSGACSLYVVRNILVSFYSRSVL